MTADWKLGVFDFFGPILENFQLVPDELGYIELDMREILPIAGIPDIRGYIKQAANPVVLVIEKGHTQFCGEIIPGVFGYRVGLETPHVVDIIHDFTDYEEAQGRNPYVVMFKGLSLPREPREQDVHPEWVVYSTDEKSAACILRNHYLCSQMHQKRSGITYRPFGREEAHEPEDYARLINLAPFDSLGPEIVVASKQHGTFCDEKANYIPGTRFYFTVTSVKQQENYTRFMGGHAIFDKLVLDDVDYLTVSGGDVEPRATWTPQAFTSAANAVMEDRLAEAARRKAEEEWRSLGFFQRLKARLSGSDGMQKEK